MPEYKYTDLPVQVLEKPDSGQYAFGVEIGGAFITFAILQKNAVETDISEAQDAAAAQAAAPPVTAEPPAPSE